MNSPDDTSSDDKAGQEYWNRSWNTRPLPARFDPDASNLTACVDRSVDSFFQRAWSSIEPRGSSLIEVGCGASSILAYLGRRYGFALSGIDYSPDGVEQSRAILAREGVEGDIVLGDLFAPADALVGRFDVAFSNGLVEHFADTASCVRAIARLVRPGGLVVTMIPNLAGAIGTAQRFLDREVYDIHVPMDLEVLRRAHEDAGLSVLDASYLHSINFGVCHVSRVKNPLERALKRGIHRVLVDASRAVWQYEALAGPLPTGRRFSPYCTVVARVE